MSDDQRGSCLRNVGKEQEEKAVDQPVVENIEEMEHSQSTIQIIHLSLSVSFSRGS